MRSRGSTSTPRFDETSGRLFARARHGHASAAGELFARHLPHLHRWASRHFPRWLRTVADTSDLVQDAWLRTLGRLDTFEPRSRHALAAYLREAVRNRIRDEHRQVALRGLPRGLPRHLPDPAPSPLDAAIDVEQTARYRAALDRLAPADRDLIVAHVELDYTHAQLGCMTNRSPNAARMALQRAVGRLAEAMREG